MSNCLEVLFVSDDSGRMQSASCFDPHIGTTLMTYKGGGGSSFNSLSIVGNDYLISAEAGKPVMHVWALNSQEPCHNLRMVVPGKPSAVSVSPDGHFCITGIDGKIYVWQISSGTLLKVISRHYQNINKIIFVDDSTHFITAGEDGQILVWKLADVVAKQFGDMYKTAEAEIRPVFTISQHSLPVTDVFVGRGNAKARLFSVSADQTCKVYNLTNGTLLLSVVYDHILTSVAVNELETELFVGTNSGKIQIFNLDPYPRSLECHVSENTAEVSSFDGHTKAITCLSLSSDGVTLASGSRDEKVFLWNIPSKQLIRSFEMKGPISNMFFCFAPHNMFSDKFESYSCISKFEKVIQLEKNNLEVNVWIHEDIVPISFSNEYNKLKEKEICHPNTVENKGDIASLKEEILKLKDINKQLYQFAMNKILKNPLTFGAINESETSITAGRV